MQAGDGLDDAALVRRQLSAAARTLLRPTAWTGAAREVALAALHLATYPSGLVDQPLAPEIHRPVRRVEAHPSLLSAPERAITPVVLVHGWVHNRSAFIWMTRALRRAGFRHVVGLNYNPLRHGVPELADLLAAEVDDILALTGAERCMIVAHSMGGVIARYYVQVLGGHHRVDTVVTLGTPHRGTYTAHLGIGPAARQLLPRSPLMRRLEETARPSAVRWIAYYSDLDLLVTPAVNVKLVHPALAATNVRARDTGHLSLLLSAEVLRSVVNNLAHRPSLTRVGDLTPTPPRPASGSGG